MSLGFSNLALCIVNVMDKSDSVLNVMESTSCVFRFACVCVYVPPYVLFAAADVLVHVHFLEAEA